MPRYFFHVHYGVDLPDKEGTELPSIDWAKREAVELAGRLLIDGSKDFWEGEELSVAVTTADGLVLFSLLFSTTLSPALSR